MNIDLENLSLEKYTMLSTILTDGGNKKFYKEMDDSLTQKRFDNAYELSSNENMLNINSFALTAKDITDMVSSFIKKTQQNTILQKRNIFEIAKISNLPSNRLDKSITEKKYLQLGDALEYVSRETNLISFHFLILRIVDNFIIKNKYSSVIAKFKQIKQSIFQKFISYDYIPEKKEKETTFLCWIDRLLVAACNKEVTIENYILICNKILRIINFKHIYVYWKILHAVNYLLLQQDFSSNPSLRKYKKILLNKIEENYTGLNLTQEELKNETISILAKEKNNKEDFYYLFDLIYITSEKSIEDKLYCLKLCKYIIKQNNKQNIFCYRFIRKYFLETVFKMLKFNDSFQIKEMEIQILIALFHIDAYFCFNRQDIFKNIVFTLKRMSLSETKLTLNNFYRYCHILDYIMLNNTDVKDPNIIDLLCDNITDKKRIGKYFKLSLPSIKKAV